MQTLLLPLLLPLKPAPSNTHLLLHLLLHAPPG
jgi:hypothetical protein